MEIIPMLGFREKIRQALEKYYRPSEAVPTALPVLSITENDLGTDFISSSTQQRNVEAMRKGAAGLQQQPKTTLAVQLGTQMQCGHSVVIR